MLNVGFFMPEINRRFMTYLQDGIQNLLKRNTSSAKVFSAPFPVGAREETIMTSRRTFLKAAVAVASGLILPSWLVRAENYINAEEKPFIEALPSHSHTLYAADSWDNGECQLSLGHPLDEPDTDLTWEQFIDTYDVGQEEFDSRVEDEGQNLSLGDKVDPNLVWYHWEYAYDPTRKAYQFLEGIDLGPELNTTNGADGISFYDGFSPGNDSQIVTASSLLSISLLQKRLNQIDGTVKLVLTHI